MNRRRLCWLVAALLLIGSVAASLYLYSTRDSDFYVIGRKTRGVRANLVLLETTVDTADYHDCKTIQDVLNRLHAKLHEGGRGDGFDDDLNIDLRSFVKTGVHVDDEAFAAEGTAKIRDQPIHFPRESQMMPLKQFLRMVFRQSDVSDVRFILRWGTIEATTMKRADEERANYLDSLSVSDRMRIWWKELNGEVEPDPRIIIL